MKTENNLQNKAAFFAQYWGQFVYSAHRLEQVNENYIQPMFETSILELKDVSQIGDEDLFEVSKIVTFHEGDGLIIDRTRLKGQIEMFDKYNDDPHYRDTLYLFTNDFDVHLIDENGNVFQYDMLRLLEVSDYLRSKGYVLPWRDLSVQDLIDYGWIKIKEDENKTD